MTEGGRDQAYGPISCGPIDDAKDHIICMELPEQSGFGSPTLTPSISINPLSGTA
jgi:hypothetical protein